MNTSTHTLSLAASKEQAFAFLSKIENLPKWATRFCKELTRAADGRDRIVTPQGEMYFNIEADASTGVIDMYGGPASGREAYWPARIVERPGSGSLFIFTALQYPGVPDADFAAQCEGLEAEFEHIRQWVEKSPAA